MKPVHEEISDLLIDKKEDRYSCSHEARRKAMDFLARREYGQQELIDKLSGKGFHRDAAEPAVFTLTSEGLQNDQRFAESFVQSRVNQGKGPVRIRQDLLQRGIGQGVIDLALDEAGADWYALAVEIRNKKYGLEQPVEFKERARQMRFLQYRGFEPDHIQAAVAAADE